MSNAIPEDWSVATVHGLGGNHKDVVQTGPFGAQLHAEDYVPEGIPLILIKNIKNNGLDDRNIPKITEADAKRLSRYRLQLGDIVFSRVGRVGSCFLATEREVGWVFSGQTLRMRTDSQKVDPKYLLFGLRTEKIQRDLIGESVGSTRSSINTTILENLTINVPPLPEQKKIAAILTSVDEVIEKTQAQINKLKDLKTGMMQELLTKGIGHTEFKDSPVGRIPVEWDYRKISECVVRFYQGINTVADKVQYTEEGVEILQAKHMTSGYIHWDGAKKVGPDDYEKYQDKYNPKEKDILFSNIGTIGKSTIVNFDLRFLIAWNVFLMRVQKYVLPDFMSYYLQRLDQLNFYDDLASGNATKFVNKTALGEIPVPVPNEKEQERIVSALQSLDAQCSAASSKLKQVHSLKKALMQDLLTGKVRVKVDS